MEPKLLKSVFALIFSLAAVVMFSACSKEEVDARKPFLGSYRTNYEYVYMGQKVTGTYTLRIEPSQTNKNDIILINIDDSNESVRATVTGNAMNIPQQTILDVGISGSGTLLNNVLTFSTMHTVTGGSQVNVSEVATKQ